MRINHSAPGWLVATGYAAAGSERARDVHDVLFHDRHGVKRTSRLSCVFTFCTMGRVDEHVVDTIGVGEFITTIDAAR
jgi:hypothetical protein